MRGPLQRESPGPFAVQRFSVFTSQRLRWWRIGVALLFLPGSGGLAQKAETENQLKADCIFRFSQFVEWPSRAFTNSDASIVIGILGQDYLSAKIEQLIAGQIVHHRHLQVKLCKAVEEAERCHILFISRSESNAVKGILASLAGKSVLTVSDIDSFSSYGGMIRVLGEGSRIRFRINSNVAEKEGIIISSKLLRLAERVNRGKASANVSFGP